MPPIEPDVVDTEATDTEGPASLRDALTQAFDTQTETAEEPTQPESAEPREGETQEQADARARDDAGRFAKQPKKAPEKPVAAKPAVKPTPKVEVKPGVKPLAPLVKPGAPQPAVPEMKAPQAWREPAKQVWAALPEAARVEVLRREKEIATQLQTFGEDRKYAQQMKAAFQPFEAHIAAEGSHPVQTIRNLMQTSLALRTAPPAHKAALVADIITQFGVPLEGLVQALQGKVPTEGQQAPQQFDPSSIAKQVREDLMKELGSKRDQALAAKSEAEISTFLESKPMHGLDGTDYGDEIRETMADLIEVATKRKSTITLEQAYSLAAQQHPEVSKVLARQEQAAKAAKANASTQRARAASSSVRSSPSTTPVTAGRGASLREHLEAAAEQHE